MTTKDSNSKKFSANNICFGLSRDDDERSLFLFLQKFSSPEVLNTLIPRLSDQEITAFIDHLTGMMHQHLSKKEYHKLFLTD